MCSPLLKFPFLLFFFLRRQNPAPPWFSPKPVSPEMTIQCFAFLTFWRFPVSIRFNPFRCLSFLNTQNGMFFYEIREIWCCKFFIFCFCNIQGADFVVVPILDVLLPINHDFNNLFHAPQDQAAHLYPLYYIPDVTGTANSNQIAIDYLLTQQINIKQISYARGYSIGSSILGKSYWRREYTLQDK